MKIHSYVGGVEINIDTSRIDRNLKEAQKLLNEAVVGDSLNFIPKQQGHLRESVSYPDGIYGGVIEYNTPYAHYMYQGIVYGPNIPIRDAKGKITGWWSPKGKGTKKPTKRKLQYHTEGTGSHWFEEAKQRYKQKWIDIVNDTMGKN